MSKKSSQKITPEQLREEARRLIDHSHKLTEKAEKLAALAKEILRQSEAEKKRP